MARILLLKTTHGSRMIKIISTLLLFSSLVSVSTSTLSATELTAKSVKGIYHLGIPERGNSKVNIGFGNMGNKTVIAVAACKKCPPAVYSYLEEESKTLNTPVFTTSGLYLFLYNEDSFILVQPDAVLGRKIWKKIGHANIYSKNTNTAKSVSRAMIEEFAFNLSSKIMNQEVGTMAHSAGNYHLAAPQEFAGKTYTELQIEFKTDAKKQVDIKPCDKCSVSEYIHLPDESAIAGVDVYRHATSYYLFDLKDGVLIYTFANAGGLGNTLWGKNSHYNVYSNNKAYIRQILTSKAKQDIIDDMMTGYFKDIKTEFRRRADEKNQSRIANRNLPAEGLTNAAQKEQALAAGKRWAAAWSWKETLKNAHFISNDWSITRNRLTGVITGKIISGIVTMVHSDGRCRYQHMSFRQDFDGSKYTNLHATGIGPVYDLDCSKI
jgi:hypothetical protein